jgi:uncharacterized membrane protein
MARLPPPPLGQEMILGILHPFFVYTVLIVLALALIFYWLIRKTSKEESSLDILRKRYANGEIGRETYNTMKKDLSG